jgi:phosphate starvation-inducible PhoH-like protein
MQCADISMMLRICGQGDENLSFIESREQVNITHRGELLIISGSDGNKVEQTFELLKQMRDIASTGHRLSQQELRYAIDTLQKRGAVDLNALYSELVCLTYRGKPIRPRTQRQRDYIKAMSDNTIIFGIGPAGTGKTYLAVCEAVNQLRRGTVSRIVLVRPAVEAGESLGFLPGDLREKVEPYLRPLYDAFFEILSPEKFAHYAEKNVIEIAPLAYMRGRTLNDSFIILDEAQNTTPEQMKMFLTRLGFGSKAVITGDLTQVDLPNGKKSGLKIVQDILKDIDGISFVYLQNEDVVRHEIVQKVVAAYDRYEAMNKH